MLVAIMIRVLTVTTMIIALTRFLFVLSYTAEYAIKITKAVLMLISCLYNVVNQWNSQF